MISPRLDFEKSDTNDSDLASNHDPGPDTSLMLTLIIAAIIGHCTMSVMAMTNTVDLEPLNVRPLMPPEYQFGRLGLL